MNARQHAFSADAAAFTSGHPAPWDYIETEVSWTMARDEFRANPERFGSWLESVSGERKHAVRFPEGAISASELLAIVLGDKSTAQQCQDAAQELGRRFVSDQAADIAERAYQLSTRS